jgi:peptidyl-tRNA hydrolase
MAQAGHAACATFFRSFADSTDPEGNVSFKMTPEQFEWYLGNQKKIVLRVDCEADLLLLYQRAKELRLPCTLIIDDGLTEWDKPTTTCLSIGPCEDLAIDDICGEKGPLGKLKLL